MTTGRSLRACSFTAAGSTSSAICGRCGSSATTWRTAWGRCAFLFSILFAAWRQGWCIFSPILIQPSRPWELPVRSRGCSAPISFSFPPPVLSRLFQSFSFLCLSSCPLSPIWDSGFLARSLAERCLLVSLKTSVEWRFGLTWVALSQGHCFIGFSLNGERTSALSRPTSGGWKQPGGHWNMPTSTHGGTNDGYRRYFLVFFHDFGATTNHDAPLAGIFPASGSYRKLSTTEALA